ncbi:MAG: hypothetical protein ACOYBM_02255 [Dethiobacteria bacterium]|jgi:hypothetical protein|nr:hypothetical protein [Bacillota bacterium]
MISRRNLDQLTISSIEENSLGTLVAANELTAHLSGFMFSFAEDRALVYELKSFLRDILLEAAVDNYGEAQANLAYMQEQLPKINEMLKEKKGKEQAEKLRLALDDLKRALDEEDAALLKVKAVVVIENLLQISKKI